MFYYIITHAMGKKKYSSTTIIIWLLLFIPVGIYMIYENSQDDWIEKKETV